MDQSVICYVLQGSLSLALCGSIACWDLLSPGAACPWPALVFNIVCASLGTAALTFLASCQRGLSVAQNLGNWLILSRIYPLTFAAEASGV